MAIFYLLMVEALSNAFWMTFWCVYELVQYFPPSLFVNFVIICNLRAISSPTILSIYCEKSIYLNLNPQSNNQDEWNDMVNSSFLGIFELEKDRFVHEHVPVDRWSTQRSGTRTLIERTTRCEHRQSGQNSLQIRLQL